MEEIKKFNKEEFKIWAMTTVFQMCYSSVTMNPAIIQDTMRKAMDAISRHDADAFAAQYASNATAFDPQYPKPLKGREAIKKDIEDFFTAFPDIKTEVVSILSSNDMVASEVIMTGTHKGPLAGPTGTIHPTNKPMKMHIGRFIRVNEQGLITECNRYYDLASLMQQLGLM